LICVVADRSRTPQAVPGCKGVVERESRRVTVTLWTPDRLRAEAVTESAGNRYSRGPCEQVRAVDSLRMSGYDEYKSID